MREFFLMGGFLSHLLYCSAQKSQRADTLGETEVMVHTEFHDSMRRLAFVHVHANEVTALNTVKLFLEQNRGSLFYLQHEKERNVSFKYLDTMFEFDPNRIFTGAGRRNYIHPYSLTADSIVERFAENFLLELEPFTVIIALHNNTPSNYSIKSYGKDGIYSKEAVKIYVNRRMDEDDFIFTTDEKIFNRCKKKRLNVVLQDNKYCTDDGSLSVYFADKNVCYINIEAENEHIAEQTQLLNFIYGIIE